MAFFHPFDPYVLKGFGLADNPIGTATRHRIGYAELERKHLVLPWASI